jgi:thioredoxin 2
MMAPAYEAAARELEPDFRVLKLNSEVEQAAASRLGIRGIPTMILFSDGREAARVSGAMTASSQIITWARAQRPT